MAIVGNDPTDEVRPRRLSSPGQLASGMNFKTVTLVGPVIQKCVGYKWYLCSVIFYI